MLWKDRNNGMELLKAKLPRVSDTGLPGCRTRSFILNPFYGVTRLLEREARSSKLLGKNFKMHWCSVLLKVQHGVTYSASFQILFNTPWSVFLFWI